MKRWSVLLCTLGLLLAVRARVRPRRRRELNRQHQRRSGRRQRGVLPGVTVTATSPAQIGTLTAVTNEAGIYRFPAVPPGDYRLQFDLAGFGTLVREGIRITLGFNSRVNVKLGVATLQETVTVCGESPVIDTSATRVQTNYDREALASLPNARDMWSLLGATPSVTLERASTSAAAPLARRLLTLPTAIPARTARSSRASTRLKARPRRASTSITVRSKRSSSAPRPTRRRCRIRAC